MTPIEPGMDYSRSDQNGNPQNQNSQNANNQDSSQRPGSSDDAGQGSQNFAADVKEAVAPVKDALNQAIGEQSEAGADKLQAIASVIKDAAPRLEREMPQIASYIRDAGAWVEKSANDVRGQKFDALLQSASDFARRQPAAAFGVAALSGFVLSRFLKSGTAAAAGAAPAQR